MELAAAAADRNQGAYALWKCVFRWLLSQGLSGKLQVVGANSKQA
jgi:hypothetical protein